MMKLPVFTQADPGPEWLRAEQSRLKKQAGKMMAETKIMDILGQFGRLGPVGGSYLYDLMVYPDLDVSVVRENCDREDVASISSALLNHKFVRKLSIVDTVNFNISKRKLPMGFWLGVEIPFEGDRWGIDCWLQRPEWTGNSDADTYQTRLRALPNSQRDLILAIKYDLIYRGLYGSRYHSSDVYDSVLERGVKSVEEFYTSSE